MAAQFTSISELAAGFDPVRAGQEAHALATQLFPICRSITGDGVRETLRILGADLPLAVHEVPSGTPVLDWTVPPEWNVREAWIKDGNGRRIVDFADHSLHLLNYSTPVRGTFSLEALQSHLFSLPEQPDLIPYRTSYYKEQWGFCLRHATRASMGPGEYEVCIDTTLAPGALTYGEFYLPGATTDEVLLSAHCCHPSLANDNLSGLTVARQLMLALSRTVNRRYSYRFLFVPGTIGSITWLARNEEQLARVRHGLVLTCIGDPGAFHYKKSRRGDAEIDRVVPMVLGAGAPRVQTVDFTPYGYDERQYCSPGFNLPVGCLMRSVHGQFPEYHTSADDLEFITAPALGESCEKLLQVFAALEGNRRYLNLSPRGEPQLGKRGLYGLVNDEVMAMLWVLNLSDGEHDLLAIAERSGVSFARLQAAAERLAAHGLLRALEQEQR